MSKETVRKIYSIFPSEVLKLLFVQAAMMCLMSLFVLIGVSLHVVKIRKIRPEEYKTHFYLNNSEVEILLNEFKKIEDSMGQISFFKELWNYGDSEIYNSSQRINGVIACGGTHRRGTYWPTDTINITQKLIYSLLGDHTLIRFKRGLVFAINNFHEKDEKSEEIAYQIGNVNKSKSSKPLLNLFIASSGYVSPCYMFGKRIYSYILGKNSGIWGYITVMLPWFFSVISPQPMMLVHLPRLLFYIAISIYRRIFLNIIISSAEKKFFFFDFSDHIVLYTMYILIISVEWCVACNNIKNRFLLACVRGYFLSILGIISYSSFFTALYFHFPLETLVGYLIGFTGLFIVFWILVSLKYVELSKIGL